MKKVIALALALVVVIGLVACATTGSNEDTTAAVEDTTVEGAVEDTTVEGEETTAAEESTDATVAATLTEAFKTAAAEKDATTNTIATALSTNSVVAFMPMVQDMEAGFLAGFNADITGFKACTAFVPMIGTIPFVSYVFELEADADKDAFIKTLEENANLRWNICTAAEEMVVETVDNFVFFIMAPLSFEQPEVEEEVEGGEIGGMEGEVEGPAAFDPEAEVEETVEETTVA